MSAHTPGPWTVEVINGMPPAIARVDHEYGMIEVIADLVPFPREDMKPGRTMANANILGASLAMLEALDAVLDLSYDLIATAKRRVLTEADMAEIAPAFEAAHAAAAQARGEEPKL